MTKKPTIFPVGLPEVEVCVQLNLNNCCIKFVQYVYCIVTMDSTSMTTYLYAVKY